MKTSSIDWPACTTTGLDRRTRRTREALLRALLSLLQKKPLNSITVTELTDLADVNRATFYTHYQDIFDMFDHLKKDLSKTCRTMINTHGVELSQGTYDGLIADIYQFFIDNEDIFGVVCSDNTNSAFFTSLIEVVREACMKNSGCVKVVTDKLILKGFSAETAKNTAETICQYEFDYIAGGVVSILNNWMRNGRRENAKQMTTITSNCIKSLNPDGNYPYSVATAQEFLL